MPGLQDFIQHLSVMIGSLGVGVLWFGVGFTRAWERLWLLDRARRTLLQRVKPHLEKYFCVDGDNSVEELKKAEEAGRSFYRTERSRMLRIAALCAAGSGLSITLLLVFAAAAWASDTQDMSAVWAASSIIPAAGVAYFGVVRHPSWGQVKTDSGMTAVVWLYFAFPAALRAKRLFISAGTLNPDGSAFRRQWTFGVMDWLLRQGVNVRIVAAEPDFSRIPEERRQEARDAWLEVLKRIQRTGLWGPARTRQASGFDAPDPPFLFVPGRPFPEFCVTDGLVRIEGPHSAWTDRYCGRMEEAAEEGAKPTEQEEPPRRVCPVPVPNDLYLSDRDRELNCCMAFNRSWQAAVDYSRRLEYPWHFGPKAIS